MERYLPMDKQEQARLTLWLGAIIL